MSPSRNDEIILDYYPLGSTTLKHKDKSVGKEPDTSFGFDNLKKYQQLGVKEVWFWINDRLEIYVLSNDRYDRQNISYHLADLDIKLLDKYISKVLVGNPRILKQAFLKEIRPINQNN
jgi:hypothetical protein